MINDVLEDNGYKVINNRYGSNMNTGIAASFVNNNTIIAGKDLRYIVRVRPVVVESFQFLNQYSKKFSKKQEKSE